MITLEKFQHLDFKKPLQLSVYNNFWVNVFLTSTINKVKAIGNAPNLTNIYFINNNSNLRNVPDINFDNKRAEVYADYVAKINQLNSVEKHRKILITETNTNLDLLSKDFKLEYDGVFYGFDHNFSGRSEPRKIDIHNTISSFRKINSSILYKSNIDKVVKDFSELKAITLEDPNVKSKCEHFRNEVIQFQDNQLALKKLIDNHGFEIHGYAEVASVFRKLISHINMNLMYADTLLKFTYQKLQQAEVLLSKPDNAKIIKEKLGKILNLGKSFYVNPSIQYFEKDGELCYLSTVCSVEMHKLIDNNHDMVVPRNNYISLIFNIKKLLNGKDENLQLMIVQQIKQIVETVKYDGESVSKNNLNKIDSLMSLYESPEDNYILSMCLDLLIKETDKETFIQYNELSDLLEFICKL